MATGGNTKKPRVPSSVTIGGRKLRVKLVPMEDAWGQYLHDEGTILLNRALVNTPVILAATLRHELMEAALFIGGVAWMERYEQEPVVRAMEELFFPAWERIEPKLR